MATVKIKTMSAVEPQRRVILAVEVLLNAIFENLEENDLFLTSIEREEVFKACVEVKGKIDWNFDFYEFNLILCNKPRLPIEFMWHLHLLNVLPWKTYLLSLRTRAILDEFTHSISKLCLMDTHGDEAKNFLQTGILSYFIENAFEDSESQVQQISLSVLKSFLKVLFSLGEEDLTQGRLKTFLTIQECRSIRQETLQAFCNFVLNMFSRQSHSSVMEAYGIQEKCKTRESPFHVDIIIQQISKSVKLCDMEYFLFEEEIVDWESYVVVLDSFIKVNHLKESIIRNTNELVQKALHAASNVMELQKTILIARQLALNANESFHTAYSKWILGHLGECLTSRNLQSFSFLLCVVSDLLPYEKNLSLVKALLERPLNIPTEFHQVYSDYVALLKTRISDLEPRIYPEDVLKKVLLTFQETGKIPSFILEASLMRKHYYLNEFLPILLTPRVVPSASDLREKFIEELNKAGKIPVVILQKYKSACLQEKQKFFSGPK